MKSLASSSKTWLHNHSMMPHLLNTIQIEKLATVTNDTGEINKVEENQS